MEPLIWTLTVVLMLGGLAGTVVPLLPGAPLIFFAAVLNKLLLPGYASWWTISVLGLLCLAALGADLACTAAGARWFGATRAGVVGAVLGAVVGVFFGLPGLILGPMAGAILAESLYSRRTLPQAMQVGLGATLSLGISVVIKLGIGLTMVVFFAVACFWN